MKLIKLNATESTNSYLRTLSSSNRLEDFTVVSAKHQLKGRGQMGTVWQSQAGKNLIISVYKDVEFLKFDEQFYISIVTALSVLETLNYFKVPKTKIKWPNDILSETLKVSGVLIENIVKNNELKSAIIGVGINVNQKYFDDLPKASSILNQSGTPADIDEVLHVFMKLLKQHFYLLEGGQLEALKAKYLQHLFRMDSPSTFQLSNGEKLTAYIKGVDQRGHLTLLTEDEVVQSFGMKELQLLY